MTTPSQAAHTPTPLAATRAQHGTLKSSVELGGRVMLALMFLASGLSKISGYAATAGYMAAMGVPGGLLPLVIATEVLGAVAIMLGWQTRVVAFLLAGFTALAALLFHSNLADQIQMIMFMKNVSISGAFLLLTVNGAGRYSLDARRGR
ncbi:MAG TPA: DoxX family protein [Roseateles sp.]